MKLASPNALNYLSSFAFCLACGRELVETKNLEHIRAKSFSIDLRNEIPAREPVLHAKNIIKLLRESREIEGLNIVAHGKNSIPLVKVLAQEMNLSGTSRISDHVTEFTDNIASSKKVTLHCFIRFFEHVFDPLMYLKSISIAKGDLIYIESLDFLQCNAERDFSYLWVKRVRYIQPTDYLKLVPGLRAIDNGHIRIPRTANNEPIAGQLLEFTGNWDSCKRSNNEDKALRYSELLETITKFMGFIRFLDVPIGIVGSGHKGITLAHALQASGKSEITFFDDSISKVSISQREYLVYPIKMARNVLLLSTLNAATTTKLLHSFEATDQFIYPIVLKETSR